MAEVDTYGFDLREVTTALIKQQGIHEGLWMLAFEFNLGAGMAGATKEEVRPMAFVQINKISLVRQNEIASGHNLVINAAEINPAAFQIKAAPRLEKQSKAATTPIAGPAGPRKPISSQAALPGLFDALRRHSPFAESFLDKLKPLKFLKLRVYFAFRAADCFRPFGLCSVRIGDHCPDSVEVEYWTFVLIALFGRLQADGPHGW